MEQPFDELVQEVAEGQRQRDCPGRSDRSSDRRARAPQLAQEGPGRARRSLRRECIKRTRARPMMAGTALPTRSAVNRITVRGTDGTERTYTLHGGNLVIGRDPDSGICLQDAQVSWQHAVLSDDRRHVRHRRPRQLQRHVRRRRAHPAAGPERRRDRAASVPTRSRCSCARRLRRPQRASTRCSTWLRSALPRPWSVDRATSRRRPSARLRFTQLSESYRTANLRQEADRGPDRRGADRSARHGLCAVGGPAASDGLVRVHPADDRLCTRRQRSTNLRRSGDGRLADAGAGPQHAGDRRHRVRSSRSRCC